MTSGPGFSESDVYDAVQELHEAGCLEITPEMILEAISPGYGNAARAADVDLVYPTTYNILVKAGKDGRLPVVESEGLVKVVFTN
ncbi:MAG: hypothetical protein ACYDEY_14395 [Acidimicrobiales bacterium]